MWGKSALAAVGNRGIVEYVSSKRILSLLLLQAQRVMPFSLLQNNNICYFSRVEDNWNIIPERVRGFDYHS